MIIKKFNKENDYERVIQFLTDCYEENKNMVCWLPERFDDNMKAKACHYGFHPADDDGILTGAFREGH